MTKRRDVLAGLAAGAAAIPAVAMAVASEPVLPEPASDPGTGPNAHYFPNVVLRTHEDQAVRFYDDLLRGRTVMINFMSVVHEQVYPVAGNLARVQELLADRLGRDVFM